MNTNAVLLTFMAAFAFLLLAPLPGAAQSACDEIVIDEAGVFKNDMGRVRDAAQDLINLGADVRVRTIPTFGAAGNLDRFEQQLEQACSSWTAPDGTRKNNLIVIIVSLQERKTGLYYGSQWEAALGPNWTRVQADIMNPRFRDGDFAGGFVNGLREVRRLVELQVRGSAGPQRGDSGSAGWIVLIAIVVIAGGIAGALLFRRYRWIRARRLAAQQRARLAKQGAASRVNEFVQAVEMLEIKVKAMEARVADVEARPLSETLDKAKRLVDESARTYSALGSGAGDLDRPRLSEAQYNAIEQEYQKLLLVLHEADVAVADTEKQIDMLQQAMEQFPAKTAAVNAGMEQAVAKQEAARKVGFKTDGPAEILAKAGKSLEQSAALFEKRLFLQAEQRVDEAAKLASQSAQAVDELPEQKQQAEAAIPALATRIEAVKQKIDSGRRAFERISGSYNESCWESIRGNGTESEKRVAWCLEALEAARTASTMERQEWRQALEMLKEANGCLDEAESFMRSIGALEANLGAAQRDTPLEIEAAKADIGKAWDYIGKYDEDIRESLEDDLREAEQKVKTAESALESQKPDYLKVCRLAREANESADKVLAQARDEHEAAERLRAKASGALRDARASVSKAEEYIEDHNRDVRTDAKRLLKDAEAALQAAAPSSDLSYVLSQAMAAQSAAEQAYSAASADVARAEASRRPVVIAAPGRWPRHGGDWATGGGPSRSGGWGSWGGGGGSTGWGSGGRGGGGSTGW